MSSKTKKELIEEIEELNVKLERLEKFEQYETAATELKAVYDSFVKAGFSETQAFKLTTQFLISAANYNK